MKNGKGKEYYNNKLIFEGEYFNDQRWNGIGNKYYENGKINGENKYEEED